MNGANSELELQKRKVCEKLQFGYNGHGTCRGRFNKDRKKMFTKMSNAFPCPFGRASQTTSLRLSSAGPDGNSPAPFVLDERAAACVPNPFVQN